jgi:hypothetical protein
MPPPPDISDELRLVMARAFDRAWERFARPGIAIDTEVMRAALARHIVTMVRDGETDEGRLSAGGFLHLTSLRNRGNAPRSPRPRTR